MLHWIDDLIRAIRLRLLITTRLLTRTRGVWLRGLLCWVVGITICLVDSNAKFDLRFQMRGTQDRNSKITVIYLNQNDWMELSHQDRNLVRPLKEVAAFTDPFFWHPDTWNKLLTNLLATDPAAIAVTMFYPPGSIGPLPDRDSYPALFDPKVIWSARLDSDGRAVLPVFAASNGRNAGIVDFFPDEDRSVRHFSSPLVQVPHLAVRLAAAYGRANQTKTNLPAGGSRNINFQGPSGSFPVLSARDILLRPERFRELIQNRMVVIGTRDSDGHLYATPVGPLSRAELVATIADNILNKRWIHNPPIWIIAIYLLLVVVLAIAVLQFYPQAVALAFLFWVALGFTVTSLWLFDSLSIWMPILSPMVELSVAYLLFVGYQLTLQENLNWRLEQEKKYIREIEQMKNNFVSLFSHDLKTPIAKIQAICDRILMNSPPPEVQLGLQSLRQESIELHRYIQSILRVSRIESSDFRINKEPSDINELIFKVCQQLRPLADHKRIRLDTNLEPIFAIEVDPDLIQEVILNLIENAIKYSPEGSSVVISSREIGDQVIVTVTDAGPGIPSRELSRIFEKFYRGAGHSLSTKGSGLGLYLVKYFVELHGGRVFVRSESSKGTRFGFALPLENAETDLRERSYEKRAQDLNS